MVEPGVYLHYKGKVCSVLGVGEHTETGEKVVVYTEHGSIWVRPLSVFLEEVGDGVKVPRFTHVVGNNQG
jgi:hypothetical protein